VSRRPSNRLKATSVFVTHDQVEAMTLADLVVVMNQGRIEQAGAPLDVYRFPATRFVATFIGSPAMNLLRGRIAGPGRVELEGGSLAFDAAEFPVQSGRDVQVGIRPEDLVITANGEEPGLSFSREFVEELGATRLVHGNAGSEPLSFTLAASAALPKETALRLTAPPAAVHLFDCDTGLSLRGDLGSET
jgi:sn-glycerol 3-phosphate transport system ATP-binding protein